MREKIGRYSDNDMRFHMPGHSGVDIDGALYSVAKYDITELDFSDNLAHPEGDIKALESRLASTYHARRALMLTEGATAGIQTMLLVAREERDVLYLLGETHKSCLSFASIIGLPVVQLDNIDEAIERVSEGAFVYVTTPNYYGEVMDITPLLDARREGGAVLVDEAHGAHFVFSSILPRSLSDRADMVVESMHKTLPVFTGGAVLLVNNERYIDMAEFMKCKIHSTSPSYLIMQSIDYAVDLMNAKGEDMYREVKREVDSFKTRLDARYEVVDNDDFTRVVVRCDDAESVAMYLEANGVYIELYDSHRLVLIVTPFNGDKLSRLATLLNAYDGDSRVIEPDEEIHIKLERARGVEGRLLFVPLGDAVGKVSMGEIAVYPPGVPIVRAGDILDENVIAYIESNREKIVGLVGETIAVRELCKEN